MAQTCSLFCSQPLTKQCIKTQSEFQWVLITFNHVEITISLSINPTLIFLRINSQNWIILLFYEKPSKYMTNGDSKAWFKGSDIHVVNRHIVLSDCMKLWKLPVGFSSYKSGYFYKDAVVFVCESGASRIQVCLCWIQKCGKTTQYAFSARPLL